MIQLERQAWTNAHRHMPKSMAIAVPAPPLGTPEALDELVPGNLIASSKRRPWRDLLVQVFVRQPFQQTLIIPAVPEPLVVWVISGAARVEERELGGEWMANDVHRGNFFLTTTPRPYELRWKTLGPEPFCVLHLYLGLPLMQRATAEVLGVSGMQVALREISGGHDPVLCSLMELLRTGPWPAGQGSPVERSPLLARVQEEHGAGAEPLPHAHANGTSPAPAARDESRSGGGWTGGRLREPKPLRTSLSSRSRCPAEHLSRWTVARQPDPTANLR